MLKLQNLEGHSPLLLPGLVVSTWQLEPVFGREAEEPSFPADHFLTVVQKASVSCSSSSKVRGHTASLWPVPRSHQSDLGGHCGTER